MGELSAIGYLRSTVAIGSGERGGGEDGEAEVGDAGVAVLVDEDVGGLDVAVDQLGVAAGMVDEGDTAGRAAGDFHPRRPVQWRPPWASVACINTTRKN